MTEKKTTEKTVDKKASEKKAAEEPDELAQAVEKVLSDQTIVPQVVKFIPVQDQTGNQQCPEQRVQGQQTYQRDLFRYQTSDRG